MSLDDYALQCPVCELPVPTQVEIERARKKYAQRLKVSSIIQWLADEHQITHITEENFRAHRNHERKHPSVQQS